MRNTMRFKRLALLVSAALSANVVAETTELPTVKVKASASDADKLIKAENQRVAVSEGAQVISANYIRAQQASTLADATRKTASIQIDEASGQQGSDVYIRGFTQDQISIRVEGAPKNFNQVRHGGAGTVWLEPDMYKSISVVPGVASNVYGNGSLGGVVLLETKDPEDIIKEGETSGLNLRVGGESNATSRYLSLDAATKVNDQLSLSSTVTVRNTDQYKDGEGNKAVHGATGTDDTNLLLKGVYQFSEEQRLEASFVGLRKEYNSITTNGSGAFLAPSDTDVVDNTYSVQYGFNPEDDLLLNLNIRLSQTDTERKRLREGEVIPSIWGVKTTYAEIENTSLVFQSDEIAHQIRFGADYTFDDVDTAEGPESAERTQYGVYVSDTMSIGETLDIVTSARYDVFENAYDTSAPHLNINEKAFSPKLSVNWRPFEESIAKGLSLYAVAGKGFRSPSVHEARADDEPTCSTGRRGTRCSVYRKNDNLKGETSNSWELGFTFSRAGLLTADDQFDFKFGYVNNQAEDYIGRIAVGEFKADITGDGKLNKVIESQYQNIEKADINGVELSLNYTNKDWFAALTAQNIDGEYASGKNQGVKLADISPATTNFTLGAYLFEGKSRVGVDVTKRDRREYIQRRVDRIRESFTIYDLFGSYQVSSDLLLQVRIENMFDKLYSKRAIIVDEGNDYTFYAPGRNIKFTAQYSF